MKNIQFIKIHEIGEDHDPPLRSAALARSFHPLNNSSSRFIFVSPKIWKNERTAHQRKLPKIS